MSKRGTGSARSGTGHNFLQYLATNSWELCKLKSVLNEARVKVKVVLIQAEVSPTLQLSPSLTQIQDSDKLIYTCIKPS